MTRALMVCPVVLLAFASGASFAEPEKLRHDPFARRGLSMLQHRGGLARGLGARQAPAAPPRAFTLNAVMVAGPDSIANVDGIIVRIGEQVHGYRLVAVQERTAVFEKDKTKVTVSMRSSGPAAEAREEKK
jgi:hypothetical protein